MKRVVGHALWSVAAVGIKMLIGLGVMKILAEQFGREGLGLSANFMTMLTVLATLSGFGIFNGITKYIARYAHSPAKLALLLATAKSLIFGASCLLAISLVAFATPLSEWLFQRQGLEWVIYATAVAQFGVAWSQYHLAILKGYRNSQGYGVSVVLGVLIGFFVYGVAVWQWAWQGALFGLAFFSAFSFLPAIVIAKRRQNTPFSFSHFSPFFARQLLKFSLMVLITALTMPLSYLILRDLLSTMQGIAEVGIWQGMSRISDAYLQFISLLFSLYLLPTLAKMHEKRQIQREVVKWLIMVGIIMLCLTLILFSVKKWVIILLYSEAFLPMEKLFLWQLCGDICKALAWVFGYLIVAKSAVKLYFLAEVSQCLLLIGFGAFFIPQGGAEGASLAYLTANGVYLLIATLGFISYQRRKNG
ncbi:hypothetical protein A4G19_07020 [Pasteurellaceae bacterium Macca]|nr:hypothetical protein [Pasteurellaceae bacterium Macca]